MIDGAAGLNQASRSQKFGAVAVGNILALQVAGIRPG